MITVGIDVGSITTKGAVIADGRLVAAEICSTGYHAGKAGQRILDALIRSSGLSTSEIDRIVATGYGRGSVPFAHRTITEITCHGAGARFLNPSIRSIIDIGGQDSKVIALGENGRVIDFAMNDKCAAGTGRFLEVMAKALEVELEAFGEFSRAADDPAKISSLCTVFAESEVIALIARGVGRANIIAGIHEAVASRVTAMALRVGLTPPVMMTGGVAKNAGLVRALEKKIGHPLAVSDRAQETGAIGAALLAV